MAAEAARFRPARCRAAYAALSASIATMLIASAQRTADTSPRATTSDQRASWAVAKDYCRLIGSGSQLATIRSQEENDAVHRLCLEDCWLGFNDILVEGGWAWPDGGAGGNFTSWSAGEPNGQAHEATDAAYMYGSSASAWAAPGAWDDDFVATARAFVCSRPRHGPAGQEGGGSCSHDEAANPLGPQRCSC